VTFYEISLASTLIYVINLRNNPNCHLLNPVVLSSFELPIEYKNFSLDYCNAVKQVTYSLIGTRVNHSRLCNTLQTFHFLNCIVLIMSTQL
jgi:hypothetical protein